MTAMNTPVTIPDAIRLGELIAGLGKPIRYLRDPDSDHLLEGVARRIDAFDGSATTDAKDVRDMHLHVSATMEHWFPVSDILDAMAKGLFFIGK